MAELIDKSDVKDLLLGLDSLPWEEQVDELVDGLPTTTEAEIMVKAYDKAYLKLHRFLVDNMFKFGLTPIEIDWICDGMAEQLKEE